MGKLSRDNYPGGNYPTVNYRRWEFAGGIIQGRFILMGKYSRGELSQDEIILGGIIVGANSPGWGIILGELS